MLQIAHAKIPRGNWSEVGKQYIKTTIGIQKSQLDTKTGSTVRT